MPVTAKGLEGIIANSTKLSDVLGDIGQLIYAGYDINELAGKVSFEEIIYLLWHGELPTAAQLDALTSELRSQRDLPQGVIDFINGALSGDELHRRGPKGGKGAKGAKAADLNKDGKVTLDDSLAAAKTRFDKRDTNKDGALTKDEMGPHGQRMIAKADTNKDGKLSVAERDAGVRTLFAAKDANKDGVLSGDELRFGHRRHGGKNAGSGKH